MTTLSTTVFGSGLARTMATACDSPVFAIATTADSLGSKSNSFRVRKYPDNPVYMS